MAFSLFMLELFIIFLFIQAGTNTPTHVLTRPRQKYWETEKPRKNILSSVWKREYGDLYGTKDHAKTVQRASHPHTYTERNGTEVQCGSQTEPVGGPDADLNTVHRG